MFYGEVAHLPQISDHAIGTIMQDLSIHNEFDTIAALKELYIYVTKYRDQVNAQHSESIFQKNPTTESPVSFADTRCTQQRFELHKRSFGAKTRECRMHARR